MTIRLDAELKAAAERAAAAERITLTDYVVRAMKLATNPTCATCGRSSSAGTQPAGFSPAFDEFYRALCSPKLKLNSPFVLFTTEAGVPTVHWGRLYSIEELPPYAGVIRFGALGLRTLEIGPNAETYPVSVPRGVIDGWEADPDALTYRRQIALGYADGNEPARRAHLAAMLGRH